MEEKQKPERETIFEFSLKWIRAEWRYLAMLNYEVDARLVAPFVPKGTELDLWEGKAFVTVGGRLVQSPRVMGLRVPRVPGFAQVDLRLPVRRKVEGEWRQGTAFLRRLFPKPSGLIGRALSDASTVTAGTSHNIFFEPEGKLSRAVVEYTWAEGSRLNLVTTGKGEPLDAWPWEKFIAMPRWQYQSDTGGDTQESAVEHPSWFFWEAASASLEGDLAGAFGAPFASVLSGKPESAFLAKGSAVAVGRPKRI